MRKIFATSPELVMTQHHRSQRRMQKRPRGSCSGGEKVLSVVRVQWGVEQWLITDSFRQVWRFRIVWPDDGMTAVRVSRWDMPREPLFHLIPQAFNEAGAREDDVAADLLAIYDTLTGSHLAAELPQPTRDRRRRLRGFVSELSRALYAAMEAGVLRFERYEVAWPFPEKEAKPEDRAPDQEKKEEPPREATRLVLDDALFGFGSSLLVRLTFEDGSTQDTKADHDGMILLVDCPHTSVRVTIKSEKSTREWFAFLKVPPDTSPPALWQRLVNLGYVSTRSPPPPAPPKPEALMMAIQEFQADHQLEVTGDRDPKTVEAIRVAHDEDGRAWSSRPWSPRPMVKPGDSQVKGSMS
ncbi:peptidoglycan-binding protein [Pendulispora rubella]|uniref:Peptidoglycan-binding protein n=1 Tax=Pendulispora rubella TaxID=2741070 RepID=A0ABZ2LLJ5_9BACT